MPPSLPATMPARSPACPSPSRTCSMCRGFPPVPDRRSIAIFKPSSRDATLIERMEAAGAVMVGALNMGEYAYDFTGENVHDGPSRNPHDVTRMTGGSSGGSGGAVGGRLVPLALGSDTNGSIRVPSSFCGIFGLKPTYGRLSRARSFPFVASFDHLGPFARTVGDLALAYDAMQGPDADDAACSTRAVEPVSALLAQDVGDIRIAIAGGYFQKNVFPEAVEAVARVAKALGATRTVEIPEGRARPRRGLCDLHHRGRVAASRSPAEAAERFRSGGARPAAGRRDGAGAAGRPRPEVPPLVSRPGAGVVQDGRRDHRAGDALRRAQAGAGDLRARRRRTAGARQYRHPHPADFLYRVAGGRGAHSAAADADRRADHRRPVARGYRAAGRPCAGAHGGGRRTSPWRNSKWRSIFPTCSPR